MTSNKLARIDRHNPAPADMFSDERINLIRNTVAKGAPPDVFEAMIEVARTRNLDPMGKQIGVAKFDKNGGWQMYMPIDGYRAIAGDHPDFAGIDEPIYGPEIGKTPMKKGIPEWASITVYRMVQGQRAPFTAKVYWEEYYGGERNFSWNKMPRTMLAKVAESHALRKAFTRSLSGFYTREELDQGSIDVDYEPRPQRNAPARVTAEVVDDDEDTPVARETVPQSDDSDEYEYVEVETVDASTGEINASTDDDAFVVACQEMVESGTTDFKEWESFAKTWATDDDEVWEAMLDAAPTPAIKSVLASTGRRLGHGTLPSVQAASKKAS